MSGLADVLLISVLLLLLLTLAAALLWRICWTLLLRWVEGTRSQVQAQRVEAIHQYQEWVRQQAHAAARRRERAPRITDPDGKRIIVAAETLPALRLRCSQELGINADCSWPEIRRHWRRSSLRWHPDQGGSVDTWLRKLRAYEALKQLHELQRPSTAAE